MGGPGYQVTRVPRYQVPRGPGYRGVTVPGYKGTEVSTYQGTLVPGFHGTINNDVLEVYLVQYKVTRYQSTEVQYKVPGYQGTEVPGYRSTRVLRYQSTRYQGLLICLHSYIHIYLYTHKALCTITWYIEMRMVKKNTLVTSPRLSYLW